MLDEITVETAVKAAFRATAAKVSFDFAARIEVSQDSQRFQWTKYTEDADQADGASAQMTLDRPRHPRDVATQFVDQGIKIRVAIKAGGQSRDVCEPTATKLAMSIAEKLIMNGIVDGTIQAVMNLKTALLSPALLHIQCSGFGGFEITYWIRDEADELWFTMKHKTDTILGGTVTISIEDHRSNLQSVVTDPERESVAYEVFETVAQLYQQDL